jgi:pseudouridine synthase
LIIAAPAAKIPPAMAEERLQKILARAGLGSRRACEEYILQGRVSVDGRTVTELGSRADPQRQEVLVDGEPVRAERTVHYLLFKPRGFVCSLSGKGGKRRAVDLVRDPRRLYTVGRLDEDSEGLIIVTNDGELTQRLTHPRYGVAKQYLATVEGKADLAAIKKLRRGVRLAEGRTAPAGVRQLRRGRGTELELTISEGLNRQVRRMLAAVGLRVRRLVRVRIGPLTVGKLAPGKCRRLTGSEVRALLAASAAEPGAKSRPPGRRRRRRRRTGGV